MIRGNAQRSVSLEGFFSATPKDMHGGISAMRLVFVLRHGCSADGGGLLCYVPMGSQARILTLPRVCGIFARGHLIPHDRPHPQPATLVPFGDERPWLSLGVSSLRCRGICMEASLLCDWSFSLRYGCRHIAAAYFHYLGTLPPPGQATFRFRTDLLGWSSR